MLVKLIKHNSDIQMNWGNNDDTRDWLLECGIYKVDEVEVHTQHTKYHIEGHKFNSVCFEEV